MRSLIILLLLLFSFGIFCSGQPSVNNWSWLMGEWAGEGSGKPGQGEGKFTFTTDLDGKIITRKSHTEFPAADGKPKVIHDDVMIIYTDPADKKDRAVYFDNEGHTIFYFVNCTENEIILTSDKIPDSPVFRLVYTKIGSETVNTRFEMSMNGGNFVPYIQGKSRKVQKSH
jgi:hypothetical protein